MNCSAAGATRYRGAPLTGVVALAAVCSLGLTACHRQESPDGKFLFDAACARCHGADGHGGPSLAPGAPGPRNFHNAAFQSSRTDRQLHDTIIHGKGGWMPAFGKAFNEDQLQSLVLHLRTFNP